MLIWLKVFLYDCELAGEARFVLPVKKKVKNPKYCGECNAKTKSDWHFCPYCGKAFLPICSACRRPLESSWKICPYCEHPVNNDSSVLSASITEYTCACRGAWMDGIINQRERHILDKMRIQLGIPLDVAREVEKSCAPQSTLQYYCCVEAVDVDGVITEEERRFLDSKIDELKIDRWVAEEIEKLITNRNSVGSIIAPVSVQKESQDSATV
jgi:RNA polymerase subunit RPABC4/transcription elongation factor Spt4